MKKQLFIILLLSLCLLLIGGASAFAAEAATGTEQERAADALNSLELLQGTGSGYALGSQLTREQTVTLIVRLLGTEEEALAKNYVHPFADVAAWANPYVGYAYANGITKGVSAAAFGGTNKVTAAQALTFILRLLGYSDANGDFAWDAPFELAVSLGLIAEQPKGEFLRGDMVLICWKALNAKIKGTDTTLAKQLIAAGVFTAAEFENAEKIRELGLDNLPPAPSPSGGGGGGSGGGSSGGDNGGGSGGITGGGGGDNETDLVPLE